MNVETEVASHLNKKVYSVTILVVKVKCVVTISMVYLYDTNNLLNYQYRFSLIEIMRSK